MDTLTSISQLVVVLLAVSGRGSGYEKKVLLISMDGFRWDYLDKVETPTFDRFAKEGVKAPWINNPFVTKTFPSHYTIVTGLYEESHGIIGNTMHDPSINGIFKMSTTAKEWWSGGEPIWTTVRKAGLKSATYFWPGSEASVDKGLRPNIYKRYFKYVPFYERVDTVIGWFLREKMNFVSLYFYEPDGTGHTFGPESQEVFDKVKDMDDLLKYLMERFAANNLLDEVNIILTSDHGMAEMSVTERLIDIAPWIDPEKDVVQYPKRAFTERGPILHIWPAENKTMVVYNKLKGKHPNMKVYLKKDIPEEFHYKNNPRVPPVMAIADEGWNISPNKSSRYFKIYPNLGTHGYNNSLMSMKPIFLARGPNFKSNLAVDPFNAVDIYPLICSILGVPAAPNNGTLDSTNDFLRDKPPTSQGNSITHSANIVTGFTLAILRIQL